MLSSFIDFSSPQVQAAIVTGFFNTIVGSIIGMIGFFASNNFRKDAQKVQKLESKLEEAIKDIHFLLKVEELHCENNRNNLGEPNRNRIRKKVKETGLKWSGKYTPGRVNYFDDEK